MGRNAAGSLARVRKMPSGADLWFDGRDIPFLQEDQKDEADIQQTQAITVRELINAGYEPKSVQSFISSGDWAVLKHTGLVSVQLQKPGASDNGSAVGGTIVPAGPNGTLSEKQASALGRLAALGGRVRAEEDGYILDIPTEGRDVGEALAIALELSQNVNGA
jgi:hypothetical protein